MIGKITNVNQQSYTLNIEKPFLVFKKSIMSSNA